MEVNYLLSASETIFLKHGVSCDNCTATELKEVALLHLNKQLLKEINIIQYCISLKICILSNNYITNIDALRRCCHITKLDLHGNQIKNLPDKEFWSELKELKLLYLHDNQIGSLKTVEKLSVCPNLKGLTLYDTPLSLHKHYRHSVVNSIWSLSALDKYAISDEEIVEDWSLPDRFKALSPHFRVNLFPVPNRDICFQSEILSVTAILTNINHILANHSPVLILQKHIRGYLTRKKLGLISHLKRQRDEIHIFHGPRKEDISNAQNTKILTHNFLTLPFCGDGKKLPIIKQVLRPGDCTPDNDEVVHINVDLRKLHKDAIGVPLEVNNIYGAENEKQNPIPSTETELIRDEKTHKESRSKLRGQAEQSLAIESNTQFRLFGLKAIVHESDPLKEKLISHEESARDIRHSIQQLHSILPTNPEPVCHVQNELARRAFEETSGSLNLKPLWAVDRAFEKRLKSDNHVQKRDLVRQMHFGKQQATANIEDFLQEKQRQSMEQNEKYCTQIQQHKQQNQLTKCNFIGKVRKNHNKFIQEKELKVSEHSFVKEFNTRLTSVTKTLQKHDRVMKNDKEMQEKTQVLQDFKQKTDKQKLLNKTLKEQRNLVLQEENSSEKIALASHTLQESSSRLLEARTHVRTLKERQVTAEPMVTIPVDQSVCQKVACL
ncbi:leucine-rich repeat and IQ domain-containing protein 3 isoform X2 [Xenopus laevis]|uniref:Leucine-rich repeat and IQ domain-containing protein 3 isoform X2 n=2 Tax=Xenopus laevis TaxID=8355 RepID=A0A1L8GFB2_XENLA|nr:leucine-rich repeat and IQ domain-containing protein 3 isoform X2 [Xenopus laevis]OCT82553.1 hypothetical protein XELAEV_18025085mg [Xenopus laevis]